MRHLDRLVSWIVLVPRDVMSWLDAMATMPIMKQNEVQEIIITRDNDEGAYSDKWLSTAAYKIEESKYKSTLSYTHKCSYEVNCISRFKIALHNMYINYNSFLSSILF